MLEIVTNPAEEYYETVNNAESIMTDILPKGKDQTQYKECLEKVDEVTDVEVAKYIIRRLLSIISQNKDMEVSEECISDLCRHSDCFESIVHENIGSGNAQAIIDEYRRIFEIFNLAQPVEEDDGSTKVMLSLHKAIDILEQKNYDGMENLEACRTVCHASGYGQEFDMLTAGGVLTEHGKGLVLQACVKLNINYAPSVA